MIGNINVLNINELPAIGGSVLSDSFEFSEVRGQQNSAIG